MTPLPVETSARHIHLSQAHVEALFGGGRVLTRMRELSQPGQFAAVEQVEVVGPRGSFPAVRVLGPARPETQVELSATDARILGIPAVFRNSGDTAGSAGLVLRGPAGEVKLDGGVIVALRHLHCDPASAADLGVADKAVVAVELGGPRAIVLENVLVRVHQDFALALHIDTDEANAVGLTAGMTGRLVGEAPAEASVPFTHGMSSERMQPAPTRASV